MLCSQVLPVECAVCDSSSPRPRSQSFDTERPDGKVAPSISQKLGSTGLTAGQHKIEQHPLYRGEDDTDEIKKFPYGRSHGDTCASCSFSVPYEIAAKLPPGAPGSLPKDGGKPSAPVLRSREFVCLKQGRTPKKQQPQPGSSQESQTSSFTSTGSVFSHTDCHDHTLTYLTSRSPDDPQNYAQLRTAVIRALSCEVLPKGMPEGPFCFGDSSTGYTIAYVFRLPDPKARGRRRTYAFVALAGKDAYRAFKACPMLWDAFATMSKIIEDLAQRAQVEQELQQQRRKDERYGSSAGSDISSFLTQRPRDPDGQPRRAGQTQPRSLAEIIGKEDIFPILHHYFVQILRRLGDSFGGLVLAATKHRASSHESRKPQMPARDSSDLLANMSLDESEVETETNRSSTTIKAQSNPDTGPATSKRQSPADMPTPSKTTTATMNTQTQCAPLGADLIQQAQQRRVVV